MDREQTAAMFRRMVDLFQWFAANEWDSDALEGLKMHSGVLAQLCRFLRDPNEAAPECRMFDGGQKARHVIVAMEPRVLLRFVFEAASKDAYRDEEWDEAVGQGVIVHDPSLSGASVIRFLARLGFPYTGSMDIVDIAGGGWGRLTAVPQLTYNKHPSRGESLWAEDRQSRQSGFSPAHVSVAASLVLLQPSFFKASNIYVFSGTTVTPRDSGGKLFYPTVACDQGHKTLVFHLVDTNFVPKDQYNYIDVCIQKERIE